MPYHFSFAEEQDIPAISRLVNSAYRGDSSRKGWTTEADLLDGIRTDEAALLSMLQDPAAVIMKCLDEDEMLCGCVYLQQQGHDLYLGMLTVNPEIQAKGIGREMMKEAESYALGKGCSSIIMTVITQRTELIAWYERRGYQLTGEKKPFPTDPRFGIPKQPLEFVVLRKELSA